MSPCSASSSATNPPVIAAQRVPPSASSTSQSIQTVRSPSRSKSTTPRSARPISRWISTVRPSARPFDTSRCLRSPVDAGSIPYSAVTQPRPLPRIQRGTSSSTEAVQITRVPPIDDERRAARGAHEARLDAHLAQLVGRAAVVAGARSCHRLRGGAAARGHLHVRHAGDRQLQEARAEPAELLRVAGGEEVVAAAPARGARRAGRPSAARAPRRRSPRRRRSPTPRAPASRWNSGRTSG